MSELNHLRELGRSVECLALELPASVWDDVKAKFDAVAAELMEAQVVMRALRMCGETDNPLDTLSYHPQHGLFARCDDVFFWGAADGEAINASNIDLFEQAMREADYDGFILFCARVRGIRPQGASYKHIDPKHWALFDACGPERETGLGNPYPRPKEST